IAAVFAWLFVLSPGAAPKAGTAARVGAQPMVPTGLSPALARAAATSPTRQVEVIIQLRRGVDAARGRALGRAIRGQPGVDLHIINGLSARLSAGASRRLAASPLVHAVSLNATIRDTALTNPTPWTLATSFDQSTGASKLWSKSTGAGIGVAVID